MSNMIDGSPGRARKQAKQSPAAANKGRKKRQSRYQDEDEATPDMVDAGLPRTGSGQGLTDMQRQLLMIDEDRDEIMNERDSAKMGHYLIAQKVALLNEDFGQ